MRKESPIFFDDERNEWNVFRYVDAQTVLKEDKYFISEGRKPGRERIRLSRHRDMFRIAFGDDFLEEISRRIRNVGNDLVSQIPNGEAVDDMEGLGDSPSIKANNAFLRNPAEEHH